MKIINRQARHNYSVLDTLEAGIVLSGLEVKGIRMGKVDLSNSFAKVQNGEVFLKNAYIYPLTDQPGYDPKGDRKLLLHKRQIEFLVNKTQGKGVSLIPLSIYTTRNLIKLELGVGINRKKYQKKEAKKAQDELRRIEQEMYSE